MIRKECLVPDYYLKKIPVCDNCNVDLKQEPNVLMSNPVQYIYKCPKCGNEYYFREEDIKGEWKWKVTLKIP